MIKWSSNTRYYFPLVHRYKPHEVRFWAALSFSGTKNRVSRGLFSRNKKPCIFKAFGQNPCIPSVLGTNLNPCISKVRTPRGRVCRGLAVFCSVKKVQNWIKYFILPDYMAHDITKELWKTPILKTRQLVSIFQ